MAQIPDERKIVIRLPALAWRSLLTLRAAFILVSSGAIFLLGFWYLSVRPYIWISSAHVNAFCSTITADSSGKISDMAEGDFIRKGEPLFSIYDDAVVNRQKQTQGAIESLHAVMQNEKMRMEKAMQEYLASSSELDLASQESAERHLALFQEAQTKSEETASQIARLTRELDQPGKIQIPAPFDALVLKKNKQIGELAYFGEPIYSLFDPKQIWIEAQVPEKNLGLLSIGTPARIDLPAYPGKEWSGKIVWISPATLSKISSQPHAENEYITIKIALDHPDPALKPGLSARARLKVH